MGANRSAGEIPRRSLLSGAAPDKFSPCCDRLLRDAVVGGDVGAANLGTEDNLTSPNLTFFTKNSPSPQWWRDALPLDFDETLR
jgi:hypothetical protein